MTSGRRSLAVLAALAVLSIAQGARAASEEDRVFTVGNYPVEAQASDAVAAKEKAIGDGQQAAFRSLLKRLVPVTAYSRLKDLRATRAADLIAGFAVRSERNSSTQYIASYDFSFQPDAVRRVLEGQGVPYLDEQAKRLTLIPVFAPPAAASGSLSATKGADLWLQAWKALDLVNALTPVSLQQPKPDLARQTMQAVLDGDTAGLRALATAYQSQLVVLALLEQETSGKRIAITLAGRDAAGAFRLRRSYMLDGDLAYTAELAAVVSLGIIEGRWKAVTVRGGGGSASFAAGADAIRMAVEFASMSEWQAISGRLAQMPNVANFEVQGLSPRGARVSLIYPGGPENLAAELSAYGLDLRSADGGWLLRGR